MREQKGVQMDNRKDQGREASLQLESGGVGGGNSRAKCGH